MSRGNGRPGRFDHGAKKSARGDDDENPERIEDAQCPNIDVECSRRRPEKASVEEQRRDFRQADRKGIDVVHAIEDAKAIGHLIHRNREQVLPKP